MRKLIIVSVFVFLNCGLAMGQDVAELAIIRSLLGVPQNTPVSSSSNARVPGDAPLKVYIDVSGDTSERDKRVRDGLIQWFDELGKASTAQQTTLELVSDSSLARVALIHFTDFPTAIVDPNDDGTLGERDIARQSQSGGGVSSFSSTVRMTMMVHTYIIIKEPNSLKIVYRRKVPFVVQTTIVPGAQLTQASTTKLRKDIDKDVDKRISKASYEKDTKRSDLKLRDEFTKWLGSKVDSPKSQ